MGQTLTHGVYLPDEGERNCYSGLAANWQILDTSVGTIAAHTAALAGKAPLVHTHTKADITDLFNSANVWSGSQTFTENSIFLNFITSKESAAISAGGYGKGIAFRDYQDNRLGYIQPFLTSNNEKRLLIGADSGDIAFNSNLIPNANNSVNLGSSSYQWNNLYAKNYYYNGVAWGLDKANVYSLEQTISAASTQSWNVKNTNYTLGENTPSADKIVGSFVVRDKDNNNAFLFNLNHYSNGEVISRWLTRFKFTNGVKSTTGTQKAAVIEMGLTNSGDRFARPGTNGDMDLGTSSYKWKSLNGINPGALSFPGTGGYTDIKGDITNLSGGDNTFTAPYDGWVCVKSTNATAIHIINTYWAVSQSATQSTAGTLCCLCPVMSGQPFSVVVNATSLEYAYIHPCKGNI